MNAIPSTRPIKPSVWVTLLLMAGLASSTAAQAVTNLQAVHRAGQTFLTWNQGSNPGTLYLVYRATAPIQTADLAATGLLGTARPNSSANQRLNTINNPTTLGTANFFRIAATQAPLTAAQGLFVHTVINDAAAYYAVTELTGGVESTTLVPGQNTLTASVAELVGEPEPVLQRTLVANGRNNEIYVHWASNVGHAYYPAMANATSVPFNFALQRRGTAPPHPLVIKLHAKGGNLLSSPVGTSNVNEWLLMLDDNIPNSLNSVTFWYGYHENFDLFGNGGAPPKHIGSVPDYTVRRVRWTFDWALRQGPIDTNRVYMTGGSMGGVGSFFLSMLMPERIAAIYTTIPKFDFSYDSDPNVGSQWNPGAGLRNEGDRLWGTLNTNAPGADGLPIYDRLNAGKLAEVFAAKSMPVMIAFNGRNDLVVGWAEKIGFYAAMDKHRHGGYFFWDTRQHGQSPTVEWLPQQDVDVLNLYRLDQSYPAFSRGSANDDPGNGLSTDGDVVGSINGHLAWDTASIVDTPGRWEMTVRLQALQTLAGIVPAPASATVDVTPRRLQQFAVVAARPYAFQNFDTASTNLVQSGTVYADDLGLLTVPNFQVGAGSNRIVLTPICKQCP